MLTSVTKRRIDACRDVLVGKLPQPSNQVELITIALIYKFMDDLDEESVNLGGKRSFFIGALTDYRWRALMPQTVSADERMNRFARGIELLGGAEMEVKGKRIAPGKHLPVLFRDIFRNSFLKFRDGRILTMFLTEVNGFAYSHSEELGNAFEYLLQVSGAQGENGQFRTPRHIIDSIRNPATKFSTPHAARAVFSSPPSATSSRTTPRPARPLPATGSRTLSARKSTAA